MKNTYKNGVGARIKNNLVPMIRMVRAGAMPVGFDLTRALETKLHEKSFASKTRRQRHKIYKKYVENEEGLTIPNPDDPVTYSPMGAVIHSMRLGAQYNEPRETEPDLSRLWDTRYPISNLKWLFGFDKIKQALELDQGEPEIGRLDIIKFLLDNKVIELDTESDRQKAVEMGLIKLEIPTFGEDD